MKTKTSNYQESILFTCLSSVTDSLADLTKYLTGANGMLFDSIQCPCTPQNPMMPIFMFLT